MHDKNLEYFVTYTQFLRDLHTIAIFSSIADIFILNIDSAFPYICIFFALSNPLREKNHMICIFAVILIFLLALGHAVDKMCVSHANENGIYFLHFNFFEND